MNARILRFMATLGMATALLFPLSSNVSTVSALSYSQLKPIQQRILSGFAALELNPPPVSPLVQPGANYTPTGDDLCPQSVGTNVRVNQDCQNLTDRDLQGRGQAQNETAIAQDPLNPTHLVAFFNNYQRGDGNCIGSFSLDGGNNWAISVAPTSFTRGDGTWPGFAREYWQAGGDPSVAWDTRGNAYLSCQVFNRGQPVSGNPDMSSAVYVFRSTKNNGASWNFPGRPVTEFNDLKGVGAVLIDKPYMTVDNHVGSPYRDRVYVTWTLFAADGTAYIYESHSADYGEHFSAPVIVSTTSPLCANTYGVPTPNGACNENQFSQPFTAPDGTLYVVYDNYNNATSTLHGGDNGGDNNAAPAANPNDNFNQILISKSTDGGNTFGPPVLVADYYDLPDCATYQNGQDLGRACVPEKGPTANSVFRATNYPSGAVNPINPSQVAVTFGSYINQHSNEANGCVPAGFNPATGDNLFTGVKTPGACNNDILVSVSNDGGASFTGTTTDPRLLTSVTQDRAQATTDQFWQWAAFTLDGKLAVSYYDRQYGKDETTGSSDFSLSGSRDLMHFGTTRVTSQSSPPPTQFPDPQGAGLFMGDYTGLSAVTTAHPLWTDTRNPELFLCPGTGTPGVPPSVCTSTANNGVLANDQDTFTASLNVPTK